MSDMTNQAINWMRYQKSLTPDRPFFMYFAPGATHAPHHVPKEWIAKYQGKFDAGWDKFREETLARQIKLGVVPEGTKLAPKPEEIKDWEVLSADEKKLFAHQMEIFAGFAEYADTEIGRLVQAIDDIGQMNNTLIFYVVGDNGTSAEGGENGMFNESTYFNGVQESVADIMKHYNDLGGPLSYSHMAAGWAVAGDTPFTWTKQVASNFGGTRNGLVIHWPERIKAKGEVRSQFHHVIDLAPTILEAAGLPEPKSVNGTVQEPIEGISMLYSFDDAKAADKHTTQYFEIFGNRAIYHDGWYAGTIHKAPWEKQPRAKLEEDKWELYDVRNDFSLSNNLAEQNPAKLKELQDIFMKEAVKYRVLPIDDRGIERVNAKLAGRPDLMAGRTSLDLYSGMTGMSENVFINIKNTSHTITADLDIKKGAKGVILAQGGRFGGWSLYLDKAGKPTYDYNFLNLKHFTVKGSKPLKAGKSTVKMDFTYDGGGLGKGGIVTLFVNDEQMAQGRLEQTQPMVFSADETADVGMDDATPVTEDYKERDNAFTGTINKINVTLKEAPAQTPETQAKQQEATEKKAASD